MSTESGKCTAHNGSYACQFEFSEGRHAGLHYAYFISGGQAYIATWVDHFSQVSTRKAPVPASARIPKR